MFNGKKIISGIAAVLIYFLLIYIVLLNYNRHEEKAKNYVEENSNRITVTLVNSDKTIINKSSKENNTKKPVPQSNPIPAIIPPIIPLKTSIKVKTPTKVKVKEPVKRVIPPKPNIKLRDRAKKEKERVRQVQIKKDKVAKERAKKARVKESQVKKDKAVAKERARQAWIKKDKVAKERSRQVQIKKDKVAKERARQAWIKKDKANKERVKQAQIKKDKAAKKKAAKKERERLAQIAKEKEATKRANQERARASRVKKERAAKKELERLARIKERDATKRAERARERERQARAKKERERSQSQRANDLFSSVNTQQQRREPVRQQSRVHHTSAADRIKNSHQSGRTSTRNQNSGVKNAYIAKVKRHLNNWSAQSNYKGNSATIKLTIRNNGKFRYVITRTSSGSLSSGLKEFLAQLNRMGLGRHDKSSAYVITVHFKAN